MYVKYWQNRPYALYCFLHLLLFMRKDKPIMKFTHLIFDLDGTLWNTTEVSAAAYNHALRTDGRSSCNVTVDTIMQEFGKTFVGIAADLFPEFSEKDQMELMKLCCQTNIDFLRETSEPMLYSDVRDTMARLSQSCRLYIVSNCESGYIEMFLDKYHLNDYITDIECLGNNGKEKSENIRLLMERNHISSQDAAYIGDTMGDYNSSVQAGIPFIFASYGYGDVPQSKYSIAHFSDLLDLI